MSLSTHPARATPESCRLLPRPAGSSCCQLTISIPTRVTHPLPSTDITPSHRYYEAVRPCLAHRYFRPRGSAACAFSLAIASQVLKFRTKARMRFTPPVHRTPHGQYVGFRHALPRAGTLPGFDVISEISMRPQRFVCTRLSHPYMTWSKPRLLTETFTTAAFDRSSFRQFGASPYRAAPKGPRSSLVQHGALAPS